MQCVRLIRQILGIKQQTLADRADLSRQAISEFENGAAFPSTAAAKRMDSAIIGIIEERALEALKERGVESAPAKGGGHEPA